MDTSIHTHEISAITGGANGIGRATALALANLGNDIIVFDLPEQEKQGKTLMDEIQSCGVSCAYVAMDVHDSRSIHSAIQRGIDAIGIPTAWINSAGIVNRRPALEISDDDWYRVIDINLTGTFFCCREYAKVLIDSHQAGSIVNITSVFGLVGGPNRVAYSASKAGIVNITRVLAYEWFSYNIRVNAVAPTFVQTPLTEKLISGGLDVLNRSFGQSLATAQDVAYAIQFLISSHAQSITGHTLPVDIGWTTW